MTRVFISHSSQDRQIIEREIIAPLRAQGLETWYSTDNIRLASEWEKQIHEGLKSCEWFLIVLSPRALDSEWVQREVHWAFLNRQHKIVPVMLESCNPEELHLGLLPLQFVDFRDDVARAQSRLLAFWGLDEESQAAKRREREAQEEAERQRHERAVRAEVARLEAEVNAATDSEDWESAIRCLKILLQIDPSHEKAEADLTHAQSQRELLALYRQGEEHYQRGEVYPALTKFRELRERDPGYKEIEARIAEIERTAKDEEARLRAAARASIADGDWETADRQLELLRKLNPLDEEIEQELQQARQKQRETETREEVARLSAEAEAAIAAGDWKLAVTKLKALLELDQSHEGALKRLTFIERHLKLQRLYKEGHRSYREGDWSLALSQFRELHAEDSNYQDVPAMLVRLEKLQARNNRRRARREKLGPLKYYGSLIVALVGTLVSLVGFILWVRGSTPLQAGTSLFVAVVVSWLSWLYFFNLCMNDVNDSVGCLPGLALILIPLVALPSLWLAPKHRASVVENSVGDAWVLISKKKYDQAISDLTKAININPRKVEAYHYRSRAYLEKGSYDLALSDLNHAIQLDLNSDALFLSRGLVYYRMQDYDRAHADFDAAIWHGPDNAVNYYWRGIFYFKRGQLDNAISDFTSAKGKPFAKVAGELDAKFLLYLNLAYFTEGFDYDPYALVTDYLNLASYLKDKNHESLSNLKQAVKSSSEFAADFAPTYLLRGKEFALQGKYAEAINDFTYSIGARANLDEAYFERGKAYIAAGDYKRAIDDLTDATNLPPQTEKEFYQLSRAYFGLRLYDQAISSAQQAISLNQGYGPAYYVCGLAYTGKGEYGRAIENYNKAIEFVAGADPAPFYFNRGIAYQNNNDPTNAIADFKKVLEFKDSKLIPEARQRLQQLGVKE
ncbi:MAG: tetratricopeptide repeat protein [Acidobacteria bacterium]|nr:tetratricopeptide repeat protein [Acidobacteriota bacterium]